MANCWNTRTGSSELSPETALVRRMLFRSRPGRRQRHGRRRDRVIEAVVLAEAEHLEPGLVGQHDLLDQVFEPLGRADQATGHRVGADVVEAVEADLHQRFLPRRAH